ncbi:hypothetical protein [Streptomyces mayteni]
MVIWQVGCVGDLGFRFGGFDNDDNRRVLVEYLERFYPSEHQVTHYSAAQYSVCGPLIRTLGLHELREEHLTGVSTLHVPPLAPPGEDHAMAHRLRIPSRPQTGRAARTRVPPHLDRYLPTRRTSPLATYLARLASDPSLLSAFMRAPESAVTEVAGLGDDEREALLSGDPGAIRMAMKDTTEAREAETPSS